MLFFWTLYLSKYPLHRYCAVTVLFSTLIIRSYFSWAENQHIRRLEVMILKSPSFAMTKINYIKTETVHSQYFCAFYQINAAFEQFYKSYWPHTFGYHQIKQWIKEIIIGLINWREFTEVEVEDAAGSGGLLLFNRGAGRRWVERFRAL